MRENDNYDNGNLRRKAEKLVGRDWDALESMDLEEVKAVVHDLRVHQIELEMQNDELRRIQAKLEESKKRFSRLYNNAPIGYLTLDASGIILNSNQTFMDMVNGGSNVFHRPVADFIDDDDRDSFRSRYRAFFKQPQGKSMDVRMVGRDGSVFFARLEGRLEEVGPDKAGEPVILMVVSDITSQKTSEIALERQSRFLQSLLSAIPNPVFYKDNEGRYLGCNEAFEELTGKSRLEIIGKTVHELWPEAYNSTYHEKDLELLNNPGRQQYEHIVVDENGEPRNMVFYKSSFSYADQDVGGIVGVLLDITDRKRAEKDLLRNSEINAAMAETAASVLSGAGIEEISCLILEKARLLSGSPIGFVGYVDRKTGNLVCPTFNRDILPECDVSGRTFIFEKFSGLWGWVLNNGEPVLTNKPNEDERSKGLPVGHIPIKRFLAVPVTISDRPVGIIALGNSEVDYNAGDLSDLIRLASLFGLSIQRMRAEEDLLNAKEAADSANVAKSSFLATMSHEIRTPMNAILGFTDMILESNLAPEQKENLEIVKSSAMSLMNLLKDILDLSKIEAGRIELEYDPFDLKRTVEEAVKTLSFHAVKKGVHFSHQLDPNLPRAVIGDRHRLYQVLFNLITNAVKFTDKGWVKVGVHVEDARERVVDVRFVIKDTGIGIPLDKQQSIFEPFTQADSSTTRQYGGTGLGLAISRRLVEAMDGVIHVRSAPGEGSEFHFTLPFRKSSKHPDQIIHEPFRDIGPEEIETVPPAILLVEDNPINQKVLAAFLKKRNCTIFIAENGRKALELFAREKIDMVLMDIEMPGMSGIDTTKSIRELEMNSGRRTPVIALTAHAMKGDRERFLEAGMDDYITKPIDRSALYGLIDRYSPPEGSNVTGSSEENAEKSRQRRKNGRPQETG